MIVLHAEYISRLVCLPVRHHSLGPTSNRQPSVTMIVRFSWRRGDGLSGSEQVVGWMRRGSADAGRGGTTETRGDGSGDSAQVRWLRQLSLSVMLENKLKYKFLFILTL